MNGKYENWNRELKLYEIDLKYLVYVTKHIYLSCILETHLSLLCKQC